MNSYLAVDLGTSFIKGAILDLDEVRLRGVQRVPFPDPLPGLPPLFCEIDPAAVVEATRRLIHDLLPLAPDCQGLVMCSQMQGLVVTDPAGRPVSNCISWRDQRALEKIPGSQRTFFEELEGRISREQRESLGELHVGLPVCALFRLAEEGHLPEGAVPASLPDFVLSSLCQDRGPAGVEATNASVHGPLDLTTLSWRQDILEAWGLAGLCWPHVRRAGDIAGVMTQHGHTFPCYVPTGDQACSLAGALLQENELSLNISTGSQASIISSKLVLGDYQSRPFFDDKYLNLITHIPAGRALSVLVSLLAELAESEGVTLRDPWRVIANAAAQTPATDLRVNLAFFDSLRGNRGEIANIREGNLTVGHLFRAAFEDMAENYFVCAKRLAPAQGWERVVFSGGLAQKIGALREVICARFGTTYRLSPSSEDALLGLLALALAFSGRVRSVEEAAEYLRLRYQEEESCEPSGGASSVAATSQR